MAYNFTTINKRYGKGSFKWQEMARYGVRPEEDIIPFSVADMELETAPEIKEALKKEIDDFVLGYANPTASYREACCAWQEKQPNRNGSVLPMGMGWWMLSSQR